MLTDPERVAARGVVMVTEGGSKRSTGRDPVEVRSLCVHGDTPGAIALAWAVRAALEKAGVTLGPFA